MKFFEVLQNVEQLSRGDIFVRFDVLHDECGNFKYLKKKFKEHEEEQGKWIFNLNKNCTLK